MTTPAAAATLQPIEVFRPGRHKASAGTVLAFSESDLAQAARVYSPELYRAPLVIGHPKTHDLAYGHVSALSYSEERERLVAEPADVEPQFADLVRDGRLLAVSASFYRPDSPANPAPGSYYLRHVGFLGAEPPAVKGLARPTVSFAEDSDADAAGIVEFSAWQDGAIAQMFRGLREWVIGKFGLEEADRALPSWSVQSLADSAARDQAIAEVPPPQATGLSYSEGDPVTTVTPEQLAAQAAELATRTAALDARQAQLDERDRAVQNAGRLAEFKEFTAGLVNAGRLLPAQQDRLHAVMSALPDAVVVEFAEGGATVNKPAVTALREFLASLPKVVEFSELAGGSGTAHEVDVSDANAISRAALEFREAEAKAGRTVTVEASVQHVIDTHKETAP